MFLDAGGVTRSGPCGRATGGALAEPVAREPAPPTALLPPRQKRSARLPFGTAPARNPHHDVGRTPFFTVFTGAPASITVAGRALFRIAPSSSPNALPPISAQISEKGAVRGEGRMTTRSGVTLIFAGSLRAAMLRIEEKI